MAVRHEVQLLNICVVIAYFKKMFDLFNRKYFLHLIICVPVCL